MLYQTRQEMLTTLGASVREARLAANMSLETTAAREDTRPPACIFSLFVQFKIIVRESSPLGKRTHNTKFSFPRQRAISSHSSIFEATMVRFAFENARPMSVSVLPLPRNLSA